MAKITINYLLENKYLFYMYKFNILNLFKYYVTVKHLFKNFNILIVKFYNI